MRLIKHSAGYRQDLFETLTCKFFGAVSQSLTKKSIYKFNLTLIIKGHTGARKRLEQMMGIKYLFQSYADWV